MALGLLKDNFMLGGGVRWVVIREDFSEKMILELIGRSQSGETRAKNILDNQNCPNKGPK